MLEQELKDIWNNSSQTGQISIETKQLTEELNTKINSIQKKIRSRDIREISASIIGILLFGYLLFEIPFPITKVACGMAIAWFVFVIVKFRKSKLQNTKTDFSLTVAEQLNNQKTIMLQQSSLLDSALYWYAIPPFIMNFIFILGLENPMDYNWTNSVAESLLLRNRACYQLQKSWTFLPDISIDSFTDETLRNNASMWTQRVQPCHVLRLRQQ